MAQNLLRWMYFLEEWELHNIASASGVSIEAVPLLSRRRAIVALRNEASLKFLPFAGPALKTLRKLKIKPRWQGRRLPRGLNSASPRADGHGRPARRGARDTSLHLTTTLSMFR
jgi:hypothetical protein